MERKHPRDTKLCDFVNEEYHNDKRSCSRIENNKETITLDNVSFHSFLPERNRCETKIDIFISIMKIKIWQIIGCPDTNVDF